MRSHSLIGEDSERSKRGSEKSKGSSERSKRRSKRGSERSKRGSERSKRRSERCARKLLLLSSVGSPCLVAQTSSNFRGQFLELGLRSLRRSRTSRRSDARSSCEQRRQYAGPPPWALAASRSATPGTSSPRLARGRLLSSPASRPCRSSSSAPCAPRVGSAGWGRQGPGGKSCASERSSAPRDWLLACGFDAFPPPRRPRTRSRRE